MKGKRTAILFCLFFAGSMAALFALDGQVVTVNGKVEFQDSTGIWKQLRQGDIIKSGTMISTGFKSEATLKLGASIITVRPLTRMTLTELIERENSVDTELYLEVGNVKAEVNSLNNKRNGFTVKSPVATASVRGTVFEMGDELRVTQGKVEFSTPVGQVRTGNAGQQLVLVNESIASPAVTIREAIQTVVMSTTPSTEVKSTIAATTATKAPPAPVVTAPTVTTQTQLVLILD